MPVNSSHAYRQLCDGWCTAGVSALGLQGAAVAFTKLGDREKATTYLVQLSKRKPDDPQVLRLLVRSAPKPLPCKGARSINRSKSPIRLTLRDAARCLLQSFPCRHDI